MTLEIISWSISMKVWDRAGIELATEAYIANNINPDQTAPFLVAVWSWLIVSATWVQ